MSTDIQVQVTPKAGGYTVIAIALPNDVRLVVTAYENGLQVNNSDGSIAVIPKADNSIFIEAKK